MYKPLIELQELKSVLRSVLVSSKKKLTPKDLSSDYRRIEGRAVPFRKFGYDSFEDFLQSIPDVCSLELQGGIQYVIPVVTQALEYIANIIRNQKTTVCNKSKKLRTTLAGNLFIPANLQHKLLAFVNCHPKGVPVEVLENEVLSKFSYLLQGFVNTEEVLECASHILRLDSGYVYPLYLTYSSNNHRNDQNGNQCSSVEMHKENDCHMLPDTFIKNIKLLMKEYTHGILATEFSSVYERTYGPTFNIQKYGYVNILSVASAYPELLHCFRVSDEDFLIIETPDDLEENLLEIKKLKGMLSWLITLFPDGLKADQLAEAFQVYFLRSLQPTHFGFDSVDELLDDLERDSLVTVTTVKNSKMIYPAVYNKAADLCIKNEEISEDSEIEFDSILTGYYPVGVLMASDEVQLQQLPNSSPGATFEITVSHAVSPSKFWVVLNYEDNCSALDHLVDELQLFYNVYNKDYEMPEPTIQIGQYCVCPYRGKWYRAHVTNIVSITEVQVHLIDIGAMAKKNKAHLRFLAQEFAKLPSQALCCHLAGVPTGQAIWPNEIRHQFVEAVVGRAFTASLIKISQQSEELTVDLLDEADDSISQSVTKWLQTLETTVSSQPEENKWQSSKTSLQEQLQKFTYI